MPDGAPLPGVANLRFPGCPTDALIKRLPDLALSVGSACSSAVPGPSHVLLAMGLDAERGGESLRLGLGRFTTAEEITAAAARMIHEIKRILAGDLPAADECQLL